MNAGEHLQDCLERFFQLRQHQDDAVFLASSDSSFMTGQVMQIDGGISAGAHV